MHIMFKLVFFITLFLSMQTVGSALETDVSGVQQNAHAMSSASPQWTQAEQYRVPVPPSGPYMSTGLSDTGRGFAHRENINPQRMYSPLFKYKSWPERRYPPQPWLPESGQYSYAPENAMNNWMPMPARRYGMQQPPPMWQPMSPPLSPAGNW